MIRGRSRRQLRRSESGFTLIELLLSIAILGIITLPLGDFVISYFTNYPRTLTRLADSHDAQISTAYFSQDVANVGIRDSAGALKQSVWTTPQSGTCGFGAGGGTQILLLKWDVFTAAAGTGTSTIDSVAYVVEASGTTLHRIYCPGTSPGAASTVATSDATLVHGYKTGSVACSTACTGATPPASITLTLNIQGQTDTSPWQITLSGDRRQS